MKIKEALEIGLECELETVDEAIYNIELHCANFFILDEIEIELMELYDTWSKISGDLKTDIKTALEMCEKNDS